MSGYTKNGFTDASRSMTGYARIPRCILNTSYFYDERMLRAWVVLSVCMRFSAGIVDKIPLEAGDVLLRKDEIASLFGTDSRGVRTILNKMQTDGYIRWINIRNRYTLVSVLDPMMDSLGKVSDEEVCDDISGFRDEVRLERRRIREEKRDSTEDNSCSNIRRFKPREEKSCCTDNVAKRAEKEATEEYSDADKENDADKKKPCGEFSNVLLSDSETENLRRTMPSYYKGYIEKLSAYLVNHPEKKYVSHYAAIISWYQGDEREGRLSRERASPALTPDPTASYDILEAERRMRTTVPKSTKRQRR